MSQKEQIIAFYKGMSLFKEAIKDKKCLNFKVNDPAVLEFFEPYKKSLELNDEEVMYFFSCLLLEFLKDNIAEDTVSKLYGINQLDFMELIPAENALIEKDLIVQDSWGHAQINKFVKRKLQQGLIPKITSANKSNFKEVLKSTHRIILKNRQPHQMDTAVAHINSLLERNRHIEEVEWIHDNLAGSEDKVVFMMCLNICKDGIKDISIYDLVDVFTDDNSRDEFMEAMGLETHPLIFSKLMKLSQDASLQSTEFYTLGEAAIKYFTFTGLLGLVDPKSNILSVEYPDKINIKPLFFNAKVQEDISVLQNLLEVNNFKSFEVKAKEAGIYGGVTVLLHGNPGTGKTELVRQLAAKSGRMLFSLNISQVRDKFVGETEKRFASVFKHYEYVKNHSELCPILLFNEADAILGSRFTTRNSVDKMENSLQNIALDYLERFEGILICTTNLQQQLDAAFERRFLFKQEITLPDASVRKLILQQQLNNLSDSQFQYLAEKFNFSGGNIANVSKKILIHYCLNNEVNFKVIEHFFEQESKGLSKDALSTPIGFLKAS